MAYVIKSTFFQFGLLCLQYQLYMAHSDPKSDKDNFKDKRFFFFFLLFFFSLKIWYLHLRLIEGSILVM